MENPLPPDGTVGGEANAAKRGLPALGWAILSTALVVGIFGTAQLAFGTMQLLDPCMTWGVGGGSANGTFTAAASAAGTGGCNGFHGTSETKAQAVVRLALVGGLAVVASGLAAWGTVRGPRGALVAAGLMMLGETIALFLGLSALFLLTLLAGILFLVGGLSHGPATPGPSPPPRRRPVWQFLLAAAISLALALIVYPLQPLTGSFPLVLVIVALPCFGTLLVLTRRPS